MSLLDNASLFLTPNAYKEGKLYSIIPSNGNGDFTVTRATTATRVNSAGLVDLVPYNLVQQSEMFSQSAWIKTNSTIAANTTTAPDGTLTADTLTRVTATGLILQSISQVVGTAYTYSIWMKASVAGNVILGTSSGAVFNLTAITTSWQRYTFTRTATTSSDGLAIYLTATTLQSVDIWGAQLVEGTSARDYLRTETRLNIPRVDYSLGGCPNILLEPQRTNLALQSSSFDSASWLKTSTTITANSSISPSGVSDSDTINITTSSGFIRQTGNIASATNYTYSAYVKKSANTANNLFRLYYNNNIGSPNNGEFRAVVDLTNLTITTTPLGTLTTGRPTILSSTLTDVGNGWYRASVAFTTGTAAGNTSAEIGFQANTTAVEFLAWGAQLESGAYATSFIPTTTASVTRNADSITRNNIFTNGLITAAGGTWFLELRNNVARTRDSQSFFGVGDTTPLTTNSLVLIPSGGSGRLVLFKAIASSFTSLFTTTTDTCKLAIKWNGATADVFQNGVKVVSATAFTPTNMNILGNPNVGVPLFINEMALFPTPLTDAQCIALTQ